MKRFRPFFVCVLLAVSYNVAAVTNFEVDGIGYSSEDGKYATIVSVKDEDYEGEVTIPVVVNYDGKTYGVKTIGDNACEGREGITKVTISNGITSIGNSAFAGCTNMSDVFIPKSISNIGKSAFSNCINLSSDIDIPVGVQKIERSIFYNCKKLTKINIPESVTSIEGYAFAGCTKLESVVLPSGIKTIEECTFKSCEKLSSIVIPINVVAIESGAFEWCSNLISIEIPKNVASIGDGAFAYCLRLSEIVVNSENQMYDSRNSCNAIIHSYTKKLIRGCKNTIIPNDVKTIGAGAFEGVEGMASIEIPNSVTLIEYNAFASSKISSITIPESVSKIEAGAFRSCRELYEIKIPDGVSTLSANLFWGCHNLVAVELPNSLSVIGETAFYDCRSLVMLDIPSNVTNIDDRAFSGCTWMEKIICRADVPPIVAGKYVFENVGKYVDDVEVYVPCASLVDYMIADGWNYFDSSNFKCIEDLVNVNESVSENLKDAISINEKSIAVNGVEPSNISIYNTAGQPVGNPVPASGVYIVKIGGKAVKVMVK